MRGWSMGLYRSTLKIMYKLADQNVFNITDFKALTIWQILKIGCKDVFFLIIKLV